MGLKHDFARAGVGREALIPVVKTPDKMPISHIGVPGFKSQFWFLTPAYCYFRPREAVGAGSSSEIPTILVENLNRISGSWLPLWLSPLLWVSDEYTRKWELCLLAVYLPFFLMSVKTKQNHSLFWYKTF